MQSSNDHWPCARACSTPKKLRYVKSTLTSAQEHSFKSLAYLYNCARPGLIKAFFVWWLRFCNLSSLGATSQFSTEWCQSLPNILNFCTRIMRPDNYRTESQDQYWGQLDLTPNIYDRKLGQKLKTLHTGAPTTRGQDWVSPTMETLAAGESQYCFDKSINSLTCFFLDSQGSRKLPPAWEEREEYDSLAPLPVIPRWSNRSNLLVILGRKGWQLVLKLISTPYCLLIW